MPAQAPIASSSPVPDDAQILQAADALGVLSLGTMRGPRLLCALASPECEAEEVTQLIREEPAIALRVLRVANSAFYGRSRRVATIEQALVLLGADAVRGIAAAACMDQTITRPGLVLPFDGPGLALHSLATALAADALLRRHYPQEAAEAFMAGLVHDLGLLVLAQLDLPGMCAMLADVPPVAARAEPERTRMREARHVAVGHERCAAVLFDAWRMPAVLIGAVRHRTRTAGSPPRSTSARPWPCAATSIWIRWQTLSRRICWPCWTSCRMNCSRCSSSCRSAWTRCGSRYRVANGRGWPGR